MDSIKPTAPFAIKTSQKQRFDRHYKKLFIKNLHINEYCVNFAEQNPKEGWVSG